MPNNTSSTISEQRDALLDALTRVLAVFCSHSEDTFDEVMEVGLRIIADAASCNHIFIDRKVESDGSYSQTRVYQWDNVNGVAAVDNDTFLPKDPTIDKWVVTLEQGECIYRLISGAPEDEKPYLDAQNTKSIIIVPIFTHGEYWGNIVFKNTENDCYVEEDCIDIMQAFARLCVNSVIRNEMMLEIVRHSELNEKIAKDAAEAEARTRIMLDAIPLSCHLFTRDYRIVDCNNTALELFGFKSKRDYIEKFLECSPEYQPDGTSSIEKGRTSVDVAFEKGRCAFDWIHILPDGSLMPAEVTFVRVAYKDDFAVVAFVKDLRQIKTMENNIIRLETEREKIYFDPLTGIHNRRFFDESLSRIVNTLSRSNGTLSLMMIDIDAFKNYNDVYGHSAGDDCLKIVAETISMHASRVDDFVARYGGDEFAVVLPNTQEDGARGIAEKIISSVQSCEIPQERDGFRQAVTVSIGVTTGKVKSVHRADDFILRADELLYKSKQSGRNRYTYGDL